MEVKCLKIQFFRGIEDLTLELDPQITVLIGVNGVGKSSILDCLAILLQELILSQILDKLSLKRNFTAADFKAEHREIYVEILLTANSQTGKLNLIGHLSSGKTSKTFQEKTFQGELSVLFRRIRDQLESGSGQETAQTNLPLFVYYPVNRTVEDTPLKSENALTFQPIDAYENALTGGQAKFEDFFRWFRNQEDLEAEYLRDDSTYRDRQLEAVRTAIPQFLPGFSDLRVRRSPLRMTIQKQGQELIINQLSDGEKCLLAMVGDIARRLAIANPGLENPLQGEGVVLIDEIELHLHPQWQRKIIPSLRSAFPNCQFIVTTHSPQVISHVEPESIYILEATPEGIKAFRPEYSLGRDSNTILEDLMGVPARPKEYQEKLQELFQLIEEGDLNAAREKAAQLSVEIGADEAELVGARAAIRRKEILGR